MRFKTNFCVDASTSSFCTASMTETDTKHPPLCTTLSSSGSVVVPQVFTSCPALTPFCPTGMTRVNTNLYELTVGQLSVAAKLTLSVILAGRMGRADEEKRVCRNLMVSPALLSAAFAETLERSLKRVVKATWVLLEPEKAAEGMPCFAASHAAPLSNER